MPAVPNDIPVDALFALVQWLALASARPLGLTVLMTAFVWGHINSGVIRMTFALTLAYPVIVPLWGAGPPDVPFEGGLVLLLVKEFAVGAMIGFLAALPLDALGAAGGAVDAYLGGSVLSAPTGEITPLGQLFTIVGLWLFAALGGFWRLADALYASYAAWPLLTLLPATASGSLAALAAFLQHMLMFVATLAGPLLVMLLMVDVATLIAAKLGKRINVTFLSPMLRVLIVSLVLPIFATALYRAARDELIADFDPALFLRLVGR